MGIIMTMRTSEESLNLFSCIVLTQHATMTRIMQEHAPRTCATCDSRLDSLTIVTELRTPGLMHWPYVKARARQGQPSVRRHNASGLSLCENALPLGASRDPASAQAPRDEGGASREARARD